MNEDMANVHPKTWIAAEPATRTMYTGAISNLLPSTVHTCSLMRNTTMIHLISLASRLTRTKKKKYFTKPNVFLFD